MNYAVDLDDCSFDFIDAFRFFHNKVYGTCAKKEDFISYSFIDVFGGTEDEINRKIKEFYQSAYYELLLPFRGVREALEILKENHQLFVITGRGDSQKKKTIESINEHFPGFFSGGIHFAKSYSQNGSAIKKSKICKDLKVDLIIDDDPIHIIDCASNGIKVLIYDQPWNRNIAMENTERVYSWYEITVKLI